MAESGLTNLIENESEQSNKGNRSSSSSDRPLSLSPKSGRITKDKSKKEDNNGSELQKYSKREIKRRERENKGKEWKERNRKYFEYPRKYTLAFVDGACLHNKLFKNAREDNYLLSEEEIAKVKAGIGVFWPDHQQFNVSERLPNRKQTNNRAELAAAVRALRIALQQELKNLAIFTDSQYVHKIATEWMYQWEKNGWQRLTEEKKIKNFDLVKELYGLQKTVKSEFIHVPAHSSIEENDKADELAHKGLEKEHLHPNEWASNITGRQFG